MVTVKSAKSQETGFQATGITSKLLITEKLYLNRRSSIFNLIIFLRRAFEYFLKNVLFGRSPVYRVDFPTARFEIFSGGGCTVVVVFEKAVPRGITRLKAWSTVNLLHYLPYLLQAGIKSKKINRNKIRNFLKFKNLPRFKDFGSIDI